MGSENELSQLEEQLRRTDYVLEPAAWDTVRQYLRLGGKPPDILEMLSDSYIGYAHMAMLMCRWMELVDEGDEAGPGGGRGGGGPGGAGHGAAAGGRASGAGGSAAGGSGAGGGGEGGGGRAGAAGGAAPEPPDEFHYLKEFVKSKFNGDKFIGVFQAGSKQVLPWLDGLLAEPRGRRLVYELSAAHRNSLLLNFAIQKIMKQGYQDEVAAAGSGLASYFSVFHKLLANRLTALVALARKAAAEQQQQQQRQQHGEGPGGSGGGAYGAGGEAAEGGAGGGGGGALQRELAAWLKELQGSCEHSQHTYLHAQHVLHHLGCQPGGEPFLAAAQQLEAAVAAAAPTLPVWGMQKLYCPPGCPPAQVEAAQLIGRMLQGAAAAAASAPTATAAAGDGVSSFAASPCCAPVPCELLPGDTLRLHALYAAGERGGGEGEGEGRLSPAPLQHPRLVQQLLACIFTPSKPPSPDVLHAAIDLLARATCCRPTYRQRPAAATSASPPSAPQPAPGAGAGGPGGAGAGGDAGDAGDAEEEEDRERQRVEDTTGALHRAVSLLTRACHGRVSGDDLAAAPLLARLPVVCTGLLLGVRSLLGVAEWYEEPGVVAVAVPPLVRVSMLVARGQPQLVPGVLAAWSVALSELHRGGHVDHCRLVLDACVLLIREAGAGAGAGGEAAGAEGGGRLGLEEAGGGPRLVPAVLELVEGWGRGADPALLRFFALQLLGCCAPPYSAALCGPLLRTLLTAGVRASNVRHEGAAALLREFAVEVERLAAAGQLAITSREQHYMAEFSGTGRQPGA